MTTFVGKGQDIARAIDNALLFCDPKAEFLPGIVHVEFSMGGIAFSACDDYATGRDRVGEMGTNVREHVFTITESEATEIARYARSARTKSVIMELQDGELNVDGVTYAEMADLSPAWDDILPLIDVDARESAPLPYTVAFNAARLARFGRVKGAKDAPVDIKFHHAQGAPIALVKVGPTFRGELQGVRREEALKALGEGAEDCFW